MYDIVYYYTLPGRIIVLKHMKLLQIPDSISGRNVRVHYLHHFFRGLIFHMPVWVAFELQFISLAELAVIEAIIQGSQLISELPTGAIADLLGKRASVLIGGVLRVLGLIIFVRATSFPAFVLYALVIGIGDSFISGAYDALVYDSLKQDGKEKQYPRVASKANLIFQVSFAAAILAGGVLSLWGYKAAIWAAVLANITSLVTMALFREPRIDTVTFTIKSYLRQFKAGFREIFKNRYVRDISLFYIGVGGVTWSATMIYNTSLLTTIGYTTFEIGIIVAVIRIINSSILFKALGISSLITKRRAYLLFPILMILCYLPGIVLNKQAAIAAVAISIFLSTSRWVLLGSYVNEHYESRNRATAISTLSMAIAFAVVATALVSGPVMTYLGGVKTMFTFLGLISLITVLPLGIRIRSRYHPKAVTAK